MDKKKKKLTKVSFKKEINDLVSSQLRTSLDSALKELLGEKKFESRIKKAAKLLTTGIKLKAADDSPPAKKKNKKKQEEITAAS